LFVQHGYAATTIADIARRASVAVDTIYSTVGRKPALLRELVETAISGSDQVVPAEQREYVVRIQRAATAREKIDIYARAVAEIQQRLAPVYIALRDAASTDADCAALWAQISERRAKNMRRFVIELSATGERRTDMPPDELADVIWSMNGPSTGYCSSTSAAGLHNASPLGSPTPGPDSLSPTPIPASGAHTVDSTRR
jgi:AcrR family transcriptional regulator